MYNIHFNNYAPQFAGDNSGTIESLKAIARYVSTSTKLVSLEINQQDLTPDTAREIIAIMENNTSLWWVGPHDGLITKSEFVDRNFKKYDAARKQFKTDPQKIPAPEPILLPDLTHEPAINQLSNDILRLILWQLSVKSLCAFRRINKHIHGLTKEGYFWREYYTKYFSCIPGDILSLTDLTFGIALMAAKNASEAFALPFWEELVVISFLTRKINAEHYPNDYCSPFMEPVYRQYPQLIGTTLTEYSYPVFPSDRIFFKCKDAPYLSTWFLLFAKGSAVYHLGFEKLSDGQYNGILFLTPDFSAAWDRRFLYMQYLFEWFSAKNEEEFAEKIGQLCGLFLAARETDNLHFNQSPISKKIEPILDQAIKSRDHALRAISDKIEISAKEYYSSRGINFKNAAPFVKLVDSLTSQLKEFTEISETEVDRYRQQIPARSSLNTKYDAVKHGVTYYHNFTTHDWLPPKIDNNSYPPPKHCRRSASKMIGSVALMKLYRVTMNVLLMSVLRSFWPDDMNRTDFELHEFMRRTKKASSLFRNLYYSGSYTPFSHVSVSSASPSQWPLIGLGLANHLLPFIIDALNSVIDARLAINNHSNNNNYSSNNNNENNNYSKNSGNINYQNINERQKYSDVGNNNDCNNNYGVENRYRTAEVDTLANILNQLSTLIPRKTSEKCLKTITNFINQKNNGI